MAASATIRNASVQAMSVATFFAHQSRLGATGSGAVVARGAALPLLACDDSGATKVVASELEIDELDWRITGAHHENQNHRRAQRALERPRPAEVEIDPPVDPLGDVQQEQERYAEQ